MRYAHISAPIETRKETDKDGVVTVVRTVVGHDGHTLRKHADRRMRLTIERIQNDGLGRGARRRRARRA